MNGEFLKSGNDKVMLFKIVEKFELYLIKVHVVIECRDFSRSGSNTVGTVNYQNHLPIPVKTPPICRPILRPNLSTT